MPERTLDHGLNGHDLDALNEFTTNPAVLGSAKGLLSGFPDLRAEVKWVVAEGDMVVVFHDVHGTHLGPWLFVDQPTGRPVATAFMLAFQFDDDGQIVDQWLGSNFVQMLAQIGWGRLRGDLALLDDEPAVANAAVWVVA